MIKSDLDKAVTQLAGRPYPVEFSEETTVDGRRRVVVARHPDLPGCMAQGDSRSEAERELADARVEFIASLLEAGLPVPDPFATHSER